MVPKFKQLMSGMSQLIHYHCFMKYSVVPQLMRNSTLQLVIPFLIASRNLLLFIWTTWWNFWNWNPLTLKKIYKRSLSWHWQQDNKQEAGKWYWQLECRSEICSTHEKPHLPLRYQKASLTKQCSGLLQKLIF